MKDGAKAFPERNDDVFRKHKWRRTSTIKHFVTTNRRRRVREEGNSQVTTRE
jgi:hypothetical protein